MGKVKARLKKGLLLDTNNQPNLVVEGAAGGTEIGVTASAVLRKAKGAIVYSLNDDANGAFTIDPASGVVTVADGALLDHESAFRQHIKVNATDGHQSVSKWFHVKIANQPEVELISGVSNGSERAVGGDRPDLSGDGRFVAFHSFSSELVPGDTNGVPDVFVKDRKTGLVERVSVASDGTQANDHSDAPAVSASGRYVAFYSDATNLVAGDTNGVGDMFLHDRKTGTTERVSVATDGTEANDFSANVAISATGRYVAYDSFASNLVPGDTNGAFDIFVFDQKTGTTKRVSVADDGTEANNGSIRPDISGSGRYIVFESASSNLVPGDTNGEGDVFVYDQRTDTIERVSVAHDGTQGNDDSFDSAISANGRFVTFLSQASNLVPDDTNGVADIFVFDRKTGATERVSLASDGTEANGSSFEPDISADGRYVTFTSGASNLVPGDTNGAGDVFVFDRHTDTIARLSVAHDGTEANESSQRSAISANGKYVAFDSFASNLVPNDTNGSLDVFLAPVRDWLI